MAAAPKEWIEYSVALLERLESERAGLRSALDDLDRRAAKLHASAAEATAKLARLESEDARLVAERSGVERRSEDNALRRDGVIARILELHKELEVLEKQDEVLTSEVEQLSESLQKLTPLVDDAKSEHAEVEQKIETTAVMRTELARELARLDAEMQGMMSALQGITEEDEPPTQLFADPRASAPAPTSAPMQHDAPQRSMLHDLYHESEPIDLDVARRRLPRAAVVSLMLVATIVAGAAATSAGLVPGVPSMRAVPAAVASYLSGTALGGLVPKSWQAPAGDLGSTDKPSTAAPRAVPSASRVTPDTEAPTPNGTETTAPDLQKNAITPSATALDPLREDAGPELNSSPARPELMGARHPGSKARSSKRRKRHPSPRRGPANS